MADYLQPVGNVVRCVAAIACLPAALVSAAATGLIVACVIQRGDLANDGKPLWVAAVVCGLIAVALGWLTVRLAAGRSVDGATVVPLWFIEAFGLVFLAGIVWVAVEHEPIWGGGSAVSVALSMILVRRGLRQRGVSAERRGWSAEPGDGADGGA